MLARDTERTIISACKRAGSTAAAATAAVGFFIITVSAPVTIDLTGAGFDLVTSNTVEARGGDGGDRDGGGYGGNHGGGYGGRNGDGGDGGRNGGGGYGGRNGDGGDGSRNGGGYGHGKGGNGGNNDDSDGRDVPILIPGEPTVAVAMFTTEIKKRRPANDIKDLEDPYQAVSFFSELYAMEGMKITHRWSHGGMEKFSASFDVMAKRWRVWSTQLLPADLTGLWTVEVVGQDGKVLESRTLDYQPKGGANIAQN